MDALKVKGHSDKFRAAIVEKLRQFSERMSKRIDRYIVAEIGSDAFENKIKNNKKRKIGEAFPDIEISRSSNESNGSKIRKLNKEVK